jgi:hypothetical protein
MAWSPIPAINAQLIRDAMLVLGPGIGVILGALYRTTGADERQAQLRSADLQTAITTPASPAVENGPDPALVTSGLTNSAFAAAPGVLSGSPQAPKPYDGPPGAHLAAVPETDVPEAPTWQS